MLPVAHQYLSVPPLYLSPSSIISIMMLQLFALAGGLPQTETRSLRLVPLNCGCTELGTPAVDHVCRPTIEHRDIIVCTQTACKYYVAQAREFDINFGKISGNFEKHQLQLGLPTNLGPAACLCQASIRVLKLPLITTRQNVSPWMATINC